MHDIYKNLLPTAFDKAAEQIFGARYCKPILLKLLPADYGQDDICYDVAPLSHFFSSETKVYNSYKLAKRRAEFITGRICAKIAVRNFYSLGCKTPIQKEPYEIEIGAKENGRPFVCNLDYSGLPIPEISITHSKDFAVATAAQSHCGIDIQRSKQTLLRVKEKYCTTDENQLLQSLLPGEEQITRLTIIWAAKEAAIKTCSHLWIPGFLDMEITQLDKISATSFALTMSVHNRTSGHFAQNYTVAAGVFENYGIALCIKEDNDNA
jgi:4'-phosphopantetheinyl transferase EntD